MPCKLKLFSFLLLLSLFGSTLSAFGAETMGGLGGPMGWPGIPHHWEPALKQAVGTAYERQGASSPLWFTVSEGIVSEVFYPQADQAQVSSIQFIITDDLGFISNQKQDTVSEVRFGPKDMAVHISAMNRMGFYQFEQDIVTDPAVPVLRIHTEFKWHHPGLRVFVSLKPTLNNTTLQNLGMTDRTGLYATTTASPPTATIGPNSSPISIALLSSAPWIATSSGYVGFSDGWQDLARNFHLTSPWETAGPGHIALTGELFNSSPSAESTMTFDLALGMGQSRAEATTYAKTSLQVPFEEIKRDYQAGWKQYQDSLGAREGGAREGAVDPHLKFSASIIKMHEDKIHRGAIVASLSHPTHSEVPLEQAHPNFARQIDEKSGYHVIWPKDLYRAAMGLLAAGDTQTPIDTLHYFTQTQNWEGSWPNAFWITGQPRLDRESSAPPSSHHSAYPILLAGQFEKRGIYSLSPQDLEMIRKAASYILIQGRDLGTGKKTHYNPSSLAEEIAALKTATLLTHDPAPEFTSKTWQSKIETWSLVQKSPLAENYYVENNNQVGSGFLELVHLGLRNPDDPRILTTLNLYDSQKGSLQQKSEEIWPVLLAERGLYEIAAHRLDNAQAFLNTLIQNATPSGLFPERMTGYLKTRNGVACPLVWAHAEHILLHQSIEEGFVFDAQ